MKNRDKRGDISFVGRLQHENFVAAVTKWEMLAAMPPIKCKVKMSGSEKKVNENTYDVSSINGKEMSKKIVLHVQSCFFLIRPIVRCFLTFSGVAFAA